MLRSIGLFVSVAGIGLLVSALRAQTESTPISPPDKATLIVRVTADATVTIGGKLTAQKGSQRTFITPALEAGATYSLELAARWQENGKEKFAKKTIDFKAGQTKTVDLRQAQPEGKTDRPDKPAQAKPEKKGETEKKVEIEKKVETEKKVTPEKKVETEKKVTQAKPYHAKARTFLFTYAAKIKDLPAGAVARVWIPMPTSNSQQDVTIVEQFLGDARVAKDKDYGNTIAYFEAKANAKGTVPFEVTYKITRREVHTDVAGKLFVSAAPGEKIERFLQPDAKVPVSGKPLELLQANLKDRTLPEDRFAAAKAMYDVVNKHMTYKKVGTGWGQGDALWACDSKYGNCTDFHSLFISMARGNKIASKFEIGFALPAKPGPVTGYHCWAWFLDEGKGWIPVDISEASQHPDLAEYYFGNLSENRVGFTIGRDIHLEPPQIGPPLNFFIYPYVEVDGKTYPNDKVQLSFAYKESK